MLTASQVETLSGRVQTDCLKRARIAGMRFAGDRRSRSDANIVAAGLTVKEGDAFLAGFYVELRRLNP